MSGQRPPTSLLVMLSALTILLWVEFVGLIGASQVAADAVSSNTQTIEIAPSDDTFVSSWFPDIAMGGESTFWVVYDASYALLQFPLDQLPPNAQIISATLSLSIHPNSHLGGKTGQISMLEHANWDENSVTWYTKPDVDPDAPQVDISFEHYAQGASDEWDVTPLVQYALGQQSKTLSSRQTVTATLPIQIRAKQPGEDSQEWYSKESGTTYEPKLIIRYQTATPTPTPTPTPAIPVLTMSGGGNESRDCPPVRRGDDGEEQELSVQSVTIAVNEVSDWKVTRISFDASGTGDEARHVKEARLYRGATLLGRATYDRDNGTVSFNVDIAIPAGSSVSLELRYVLDPDKMEWDNEANRLAKTYRTTTGIDNLSALPLNGATQYKMLPPEPILGPMHYIARVWNITSFPRQGFGTIQAAVDAIVTQDGNTLELCPGEFVENVRVITIRGGATVRAAKSDQPTFTLTRSNTTIENLIITGATGNGAAGILAAGESALRPLTNITIQYTQINNNFYGIFFRHVEQQPGAAKPDLAKRVLWDLRGT
ncbi:MAG: DNRLRE domain-containing protein [Chloroflexi bacterium]|nr:DNRLRE domain-containing protein [Chloroflexota bacterium]